MLLILKLYICEIFERKRQKGASNMWKFIKCKEADGPEGKVGGGGFVCVIMVKREFALKSFWHKRAAFQSVGVRAVDWQQR